MMRVRTFNNFWGSLRDNHMAWLVADIQLRLMSTFTSKKSPPRIHTKVSVLR